MSRLRAILDAITGRTALLRELDQLRERVAKLEAVSREHEALRCVLAGKLVARTEVRA